jgi:hypothetical protein
MAFQRPTNETPQRFGNGPRLVSSEQQRMDERPFYDRSFSDDYVETKPIHSNGTTGTALLIAVLVVSLLGLGAVGIIWLQSQQGQGKAPATVLAPTQPSVVPAPPEPKQATEPVQTANPLAPQAAPAAVPAPQPQAPSPVAVATPAPAASRPAASPASQIPSALQPTAPPPAPTAPIPAFNAPVSTTSNGVPVLVPTPSPQSMLGMSGLSETDVKAFIERAEGALQRDKDVIGARAFLERAAIIGHPRALFLLAQTYDADALKQLGIAGIRPNPAKARELYQNAASAGSEEAKARLATLR